MEGYYFVQSPTGDQWILEEKDLPRFAKFCNMDMDEEEYISELEYFEEYRVIDNEF